MNLSQLKKLIKQGESENLEFKTATTNLHVAMQTICAFLNNDIGGILVFGVRDNGELVGQEVSDKTKREIAAEINKIEPQVKIDVQYVPIKNKNQAIVLSVSPGEKLPYMYDGRAYTRTQSTTRRMPNEEFAYLYKKTEPTLWESLTTSDCTIKDLDKNRINEVVRTGVFEKRLPESALRETIPNILKKFNLIINNKLTNAAVILFCKNEDKQFKRSYINLAKFKGVDKSEFLDNKSIIGNAFDLYDQAMKFLHFVLPVSARVEEGKAARVETPAIPYKVLREALVNALVHRDYSNAGGSGSISVAVYDDRVNITNIGALPKGVELNELSKDHPSVQRNPDIAHVFYICAKIERWGRGTLDMIKDCKEAGNPPPKFEEVGDSFSVTFPLKKSIPSVIYKEEKKETSLTERQKEIINALKNGPLNRQQIMENMSTVLTDRATQKELTKLKDLGIIKLEGKGKTAIWSLN